MPKIYPYIIALFLLLTACTQPQSSSPVSEESQPSTSIPTSEMSTTTPSPSEPIQPEPIQPELVPAQEPKILLSFAGDSMMAGRVADVVKLKGSAYPFTDAAPIFQQSDIAMLNLETSISTRGTAKEKAYTFRSEPQMAEALKKAGVDIVTVANNHALDYGVDAFIDTLAHLDERGVEHVGGGMNQEEAYAPVKLTVKGKTIQFFGFSRVLAEASWHAGRSHPGMASAYDPTLVYNAVQKHVSDTDYTAVYLHWGEELAQTPLPYQVDLAHGLIDLGVDLVIGSHPHVLQGMEWYKGKMIAYSLGNFVFTTSRLEEGRQSGILQVTLQGDEIIPKFIPMFIDQGAVWIADESKSQQIMNRLSELSIGGVWDETRVFLSNE